jgi:hypothetical protein
MSENIEGDWTVSNEETVRRIKLAIDRQRDGDHDPVFDDKHPLEAVAEHSVGGIVLVIVKNGPKAFGIDDQGSCFEAVQKKPN